MTELQRICGKCSIPLTPENTGQLQHLQTYCNECTDKYEKEFNHHFYHHYFLNNKDICILCGYIKE